MHLILLQPDYVNYDRVMKKKQYMHLIFLQPDYAKYDRVMKMEQYMHYYCYNLLMSIMIE